MKRTNTDMRTSTEDEQGTETLTQKDQFERKADVNVKVRSEVKCDKMFGCDI